MGKKEVEGQGINKMKTFNKASQYLAVCAKYRKEANLPILPKRISASGEVRLKLWNPVQRKQEEVTYIFRLSLDLTFILTGNQNKLIKIQCHKVNKPLQGMAP